MIIFLSSGKNLVMKILNFDKKNKKIIKPKNLNENIIVGKKLNINIDATKFYEKQNFVKKSTTYVIKKICFYPILKVYGKLFLSIKIVGKNNLKPLQGGAISVCNHCHYLDWCISPVFLFTKRKVITIALKDNFKIPYVRFLCTIFNCVPIGDTFSENLKLFDYLKSILNNKGIIHIFPEASMWPYYSDIRSFKKGAFYFAVKFDVPIVPFVILFKKVNKIKKVFKKQPDLKIVVFSPQYANKSLDPKTQIIELKNRVESLIKETIDKNHSYKYYNYVEDDAT